MSADRVVAGVGPVSAKARASRRTSGWPLAERHVAPPPAPGGQPDPTVPPTEVVRRAGLVGNEAFRAVVAYRARAARLRALLDSRKNDMEMVAELRACSRAAAAWEAFLIAYAGAGKARPQAPGGQPDSARRRPKVIADQRALAAGRVVS